jgi:hypothetical protein
MVGSPQETHGRKDRGWGHTSELFTLARRALDKRPKKQVAPTAHREEKHGLKEEPDSIPSCNITTYYHVHLFFLRQGSAM